MDIETKPVRVYPPRPPVAQLSREDLKDLDSASIVRAVEAGACDQILGRMEEAQ